MKKIKYFFIRQYAKIIRFLISLSVISVFIFGSFSVSAAESYYFYFSQPQVTDTSCYFEIVRSDGYCCVVYGFAGSTPQDFVATLSNGRIYFEAVGVDGEYQSFYLLDRWTGGTLLPRNNGLYYFDLAGFGVGAIYAHNAYYKGFSSPTIDRVFLYGQDLQVNDNFTAVISLLNQLKSSGATAAQLQQVITSIGNLDNHTNGNLKLILEAIKNQTTTQNAKLDEILQAIRDNKSSAENNEYTSPDTSNASQYESAESQLMDTTASGRSSAVDTMKGIGGILDNHVGKSLLATSKLMSEFLGIGWLGDIVRFALVCGLFAFVLGISVMIIGTFGNWHVASRRADVDYNSHRKRLGK